MQNNESGSVKNRVNALSDAKRLLLESLLEEQRKKKRQIILQDKGLHRVSKRAPELTVLPSNYMQKKIWYVEQLFNESITYNVSGYVKFHGKLQVELLHKAFRTVVKQQEVLRSKFKGGQGQLEVELSEDTEEPAFRMYDCSQAGMEISPDDIRQRMYTEGIQPFRLAEGKLIRLICYKLSETEWIGQIVWHHIVSDGYSSGIFIRELLQLYEAYTGASMVPVQEPVVQYYDYVIHMNERIAKGEFDHQLKFWREQLSGSSMSCMLPTDYTAGHGLTYHGERVAFSIRKEMKVKLEAAAKKHGVTLFVLLMSALKIMLHKYVHQNDIIVGVPVTGRNEEECQSIIGCFLNMLPIRSNIGEEQPLFDYIQAENAQVMQALKHQDLPFDFIVEDLKVERDLLSTPIYQVVFSYETNALKDITTKDFYIEFEELDLKTAKVDLALEVNDEKDGLSAWFEYKSDKFSRERIEKIKDYYLNILQFIAEYDNQPIKNIEMIPEEEKDEILYSFNEKVTDYKPQTIKQLFETQAALREEAVAIVCGNERITYRELNNRSNQLAHHLRKYGVGCESLVAIMLDKSIEAIIAILGVTKAGGAYMPVDSAYPRERMEYILEDSNVRYMITSGIHQDYAGIEQISMGDKHIDTESTDNLTDHSNPDNLAYVIYTSGTTGQPKGVMVEHSGIVNLRDYFWDKYKVTTDDTILQFANLVFDASVWEMIMGILTGARLCIITKEVALDVNLLELELKRHNVTVATLPPPYWNVIADRPIGIRLLITAGSAASVNLVENLPEPIEYFNAYGPTETTVCASDWQYERTVQIPNRIPIGKPIANMQIYIMNYTSLCGKGIIGELCIAGVGIARGYLNRPELTAEKFIDNPYGPGKLYRTGDYASWLNDGNIAFTGRIDHQVKIRGHRIEIGEIENKLSSHNRVIEAVVIPEIDHKSNLYLAAYVVVDAAVTLTEIRSFLNDGLPSYMIPSAFYTLEAIPLNMNGKPDNSRLASLGQPMEAENDFAEPTTEIERTLERIWCELLGVERVSIRDHFFEIGGDSIISMQVIAKAAEAGIKLELKSFYDDKCIEQMALKAAAVEHICCDQGEVTGTYLLTPIQQWFFTNNFPENNHWNQSVSFELKQTVDAGRLNEALNEVCRQHDLLRTRVLPGKAPRYADILPFAYSERLKKVEITACDDYEQRIQQELPAFQQSLNLQAGEVFKGLLIVSDTWSSSRLVLTAHHLVCDAVSFRFIAEDVLNGYQALIDKREVRLPQKTSSFIRWSNAAEAYAGSHEAVSKKKEWTKEIGAHSRKTKRGCSSIDNLEGEAEHCLFSLSEEDTAKLMIEVPKHYSIQPIEVMIAALETILHEWDGADHTLYLESHGRDMLADQVDLSRTVGWFTNLYPLYFSADDISTTGATLKKVKDRLAAVQKRKFEFLLSDYPREAMDIVFNYMGHLDNKNPQHEHFRLITGEPLYTRGLKNTRVSLLEVNGYIQQDRLTFEWGYNPNIHSGENIVQQANAFTDTLRGMISYCIESEDDGVSAADFDDVDMEDLDFILAKFN
ncbi:amino acid adenylation domain-containing protein [Paenibacillus sp. FSL P2-0136]|uniref:amino acid adenylation domain-containing protein n=1 Tax=Paenibacillus sp. FSL P2-0136 TaxID=2975317 RepID=UPI0030D91554